MDGSKSLIDGARPVARLPGLTDETQSSSTPAGGAYVQSVSGRSDHPRPIALSDEEILDLPVDVLALQLLDHLASHGASGDTHHVHNALNSWRAAGVNSNGPAMRALSEGYAWLDKHALIAVNPQGSPYNGFITRLGYRVLADGLRLVDATERLSADLHRDIASVRSQFLLGEYELAAFAAMRAVEIRVREAGHFTHADIGVPLMRKAFNSQSGPLTDDEAEGGERQGVSDLFAGAFAVFKNPTSHRAVTYDDPTEAAEVIGLASLLLRILDRHTGVPETG